MPGLPLPSVWRDIQDGSAFRASLPHYFLSTYYAPALCLAISHGLHHSYYHGHSFLFKRWRNEKLEGGWSLNKKCSRTWRKALCLDYEDMFRNRLTVDSQLQNRFSLGPLWITKWIPNEKVNSHFESVVWFQLYQWYRPGPRAGNSQFRVCNWKSVLSV